MKQKAARVLSILIFFTCVFIFMQLLFVVMTFVAKGSEAIAQSALKSELLTTLLLVPLLQLVAAQIIIYIFYIYVLWYLTVSFLDFFPRPRVLAVAISILGMVVILTANTYYVSHSFFAKLIRHDLLQDSVSDAQLKVILILTAIVLIVALLKSLLDLAKGRHIILHSSWLGLFLCLIVLYGYINASPTPSSTLISQPNIIIIGFDALRPDALSKDTPNFNNFLKSAVVFTDTYTPLARTFPSLTTILTAKYPLHHQIREDSIAIDKMDLTETLPAVLQRAGYETIFAADDNRFSYINHEFGFDRIVGDRGDIKDYVINAINDFPLSNLLIPTLAGKLLFPYSYANHAAAFTHDPNNFLNLIEDALNRPQTKPLFLQVHFNVTAWPFYRFNDRIAYDARTLDLYAASVKAADQVLGSFLAMLQNHGLLQNTWLVLLSDHGMTFAERGERLTSMSLYQGDKNKIHLQRTKYSGIKKSLDTALNSDNYGIDTSFGYGGDVLSILQNHSLLAFKTFGLPAHKVSVIAGLQDVAPTLLDVLGLPHLQHADGISLKRYFNSTLPTERPIFLESGYSIPEIQQDGILVDRVLVKTINLYQVDADSGLITMLPATEKISIANKQRAIMQGEWLLAYYPAALRYKLMPTHRVENYIAEPYAVLVNLQSGQWTVELESAFARHAPVAQLNQQLQAFYGKEMENYL